MRGRDLDVDLRIAALLQPHVLKIDLDLVHARGDFEELPSPMGRGFDPGDGFDNSADSGDTDDDAGDYDDEEGGGRKGREQSYDPDFDN